MARVTVEDCLERVDNRFALVHMAAKRTRMLLAGDRPLVNAPKNKASTVSLREIADGKIEMIEERRQIRRRSIQRRRRRFR